MRNTFINILFVYYNYSQKNDPKWLLVCFYAEVKVFSLVLLCSC